MRAKKTVRESRHCSKGGDGGFAMWGVARVIDERDIDGAVALLLRDLDLSHGPVGIVGALYDGDRHAHVSKSLGDIEAPKRRVQPGVSPAVESVVHVAVPSRQALLEIVRFVSLPGLPDRLNSRLFRNEVRRDQHQSADAMVLNATGIDRRNRCAVRMTKQQSTPEADRIEDLGENVESFTVHVIERPRQRYRR